VDVVFAVDGSGSMDALVAEFLNSINGFASAISATSDLRVVLVGLTGFCVLPPLGSGSCPEDADPPGYTHVAVDVASTDALSRIIETHATWGPQIRPGSTKLFVVVSDDDSGLSAAAFDTSLLALDPSLEGYVFSAYVADFDGSPLDPCFPATPGDEYVTLQGMTGGILGNLCDTQLSVFMVDLAGSL
jgi:hypothetical protein